MNPLLSEATVGNTDDETTSSVRRPSAPSNDQHRAEVGSQPESKQQPPQTGTVAGFKLAFLLGSLTIASILIFIDTSIISTAIPKITDEFHSLPDVGWYGSAYQLGSAVFVPLTGSIYHSFPLKWSYLTFFLLFEVGSAICGAAPSSAALIIGRVVAGVGASGLNSGAFTILAATVPAEKRPPLLGLLFGIAQLGAVLGPLIGGAFTANVSWRWCFYINLPLAPLVAIPLLVLHVPEQIPKQGPAHVLRQIHRHIDFAGFALFTGSIVQLLLALQFGDNQYAWNSSQIIGLFVGAGVTLIAWATWNRYAGERALIPFHIIKKTVVLFSGINFAFLLATVYGSLYFLPIYFQTVKGAGPILSGVYLLAIILPQLVSAVASGKLVSIVGIVPPFALIGGALNTVGMGLYSLLQPSTTVGHWIGFSILCGFGRGIGLNSPLIATQAAVTPQEIAAANAFIVWCQYIGPTIFLTLFNVVFDTSLRSQLRLRAPDVDAEAVIAAGATNFHDLVSAQDLPHVLAAYSTALDYAFYLGAGAAALSWAAAWGMGWKSIAKKDQPQGAEVKTPADAESSSAQEEKTI
ncbi:MFS general substrate transporter [Xylariaceae sp. FL1272]|nr:MFS general substrate transporter [Xylariaceae sp. FL1272]